MLEKARLCTKFSKGPWNSKERGCLTGITGATAHAEPAFPRCDLLARVTTNSRYTPITCKSYLIAFSRPSGEWSRSWHSNADREEIAFALEAEPWIMHRRQVSVLRDGETRVILRPGSCFLYFENLEASRVYVGEVLRPSSVVRSIIHPRSSGIRLKD